ncbi:MAG TPA: hypothetical protein VFF68_12860 [Anaerolineaceae bacterium]|nr:hypothetical protein [Anaerolineaceae bacterium]
MNEVKRFSLVKPTVHTPFQIDFAWWRSHDNNWRLFLHSMLCEDHQAAFSTTNADVEIDWVDPETAEVQKVDGLQQVLILHCAKQPEFITDHMALVDSVFRILLANGNQPMTPAQLSERTGKPAETILKTLASPRVYKGIRPCQS